MDLMPEPGFARDTCMKNERQGPLEGRSAVCFGDSVTWYDGHPYTWGKEAGKKARGFESYLREKGMRVSNEGISNATILKIRERVFMTDLKGFDYVFLTSGANDSRFDVPLGSLLPRGSAFDTASFLGCLQSCVEHILDENGSAKIILMTPLNGWIWAPRGYEYPRKENGRVEKRYADALLRAGAYYSCPVCDWFNGIEMTESARPVMINDPEPDSASDEDPNPLYSLHPSTVCYGLMARMLLDTILNA